MELKFDLGGVAVPFGPAGSDIADLALDDQTEFGIDPVSGAVTPNPFLNFRFSAIVTPPNATTSFVLPGFFAADGTNGDTQGGHIGPGSVWKLRLTPDERVGDWTIQCVLEVHDGSVGAFPGFDASEVPINVSDEPVVTTGSGVAWLGPLETVGVVGPFLSAPGFRGRGFVRANPGTQPVGGWSRYLTYSYSQLTPQDRYFLKIGVNSPENFFSYQQFYRAMKLDRHIMNPGAVLADTGFYVAGPGTGKWHRFNAPEAGLPVGMGHPTHEGMDWHVGDPEWITTRNELMTTAGCQIVSTPINGPATQRAGHGIIGALNYLASFGMNSIYVEPMNLGGDGSDTYPFAMYDCADLAVDLQYRSTGPSRPESVFSYCTKRLLEWNTVIDHASRKGILMHFQLHESEKSNQTWLAYNLDIDPSTSTWTYTTFNAPTVGNPDPRCDNTHARRLYLKQLVAHFGHHLGVQWNLCEENDPNVNTPGTAGDPIKYDFTRAQLVAMAEWIERWDSYHDHPITVESHGTQTTVLFPYLVENGQPPWLDVTSGYIYGGEPDDVCGTPTGNPGLGTEPHLYDKETEDVRWYLDQAFGPGDRVIVSIDEQGNWRYGASGVTADPAADPNILTPSYLSSPEGRRRLVLYDVLFSGGSLEWYGGYGMDLDGILNDGYYECLSNPLLPSYSSLASWMQFGGGDVSIEEFRSREDLWKYSQAARRIMNLIPFWAATPYDEFAVNDPHPSSGPTGPMVGSNSGAYGPGGTFGRAQTLAYLSTSLSEYLVHYPTAYNGSIPLVLGTLNVPVSDAGYAGQYYDPSTGDPVGPAFTFPDSTTQMTPPAAPLWLDPSRPGPDVVLLVQAL